MSLPHFTSPSHLNGDRWWEPRYNQAQLAQQKRVHRAAKIARVFKTENAE